MIPLDRNRFLRRPVRAGVCDCGALIETRLPTWLRRQAICRGCVMSVVTAAKRYPADSGARITIVRWALQYGFCPERALEDPDELIAFIDWCSRRAPCGLEDQLYRWISQHIVPADSPRRSA